MSYFRTSQEVEQVFAALFERFLESDDGARVAKLAAGVAVTPVLELRLTDPEAILHVDLEQRRVAFGPAQAASVHLELEASTLHDVLLERLDPVQISRAFEEDRAVIDGAPEALVGLITVAGALARHYPASLESLARDDLLETPQPPQNVVWGSGGPPKRVIGTRRPWQRPRHEAQSA